MNEKLRVLITGDRNWRDAVTIFNTLEAALEEEFFQATYPDWDGYGNSFLEPSDVLIVHGDARGADTIADVCSQLLGFQIESYPANWTEHKRAAGPIRNRVMLDTGIDYWLAFHTDLENSKGTRDMVDLLVKAELPGRVIAKEIHG